MKRASTIKRAGEWRADEAVDSVLLDADDRRRRRLVLVTESGVEFLLDLPQVTALKDGDGLVLGDGSIIRVKGAAEPLIEIAAATPLAFVRLAWHLGNRHTDVQLVGDKLRIRRDHVLEEMVRRLGGATMPVQAPFDPEAVGSGHGSDHLPHGHEHGA